jgi:tetratricopeptide (TPR) repeat protein
MKSKYPERCFISCLIPGMLLLSSCASTDTPADAAAIPVQFAEEKPETATAAAKKKLALAYLEMAGEQIRELDDAETRRETGLSLACVYALLEDRQGAQQYLKAPPPLPSAAASQDAYIQYLTLLAALGDYEELEANIQRAGNPEAEAMIRGFTVYYDALLERSHLAQSLQDAAMCINEDSDPHTRFYLAFGYHAAGNRAACRKTCLRSGDPYQRFVSCSYMAAMLGMTGSPREADFYLEQAHSEQDLFPEGTQIDDYTQMIHGRASALAGRIEEATETYARLEDRVNAMYIGSVLASRLRAGGHAIIADSIIRNTDETFARLRNRTGGRDSLYTAYGDFLTTLELYDKLNGELRRTPEPLLKACLLLGGAQALADEIVYAR